MLGFSFSILFSYRIDQMQQLKIHLAQQIFSLEI